MSRIDGILDQLRRLHEGKAWHGPSARGVLKGISARGAAARPLGSAHSIWEIVLHMTTWKNCVHRTLAGEQVRVSAARDWPRVVEVSEEAWRAAVHAMNLEHETLLERVRDLPEDELDHPPRRLGQPAYRLIHGIIQHDVYHTGQIQLLKKAVKERPGD